MASWEKEKAYCAKRAQELAQEMESAIEAKDRERFAKAHQTAMRYMPRKQLNGLYRRYLATMTGKEA